MDARDVIIEMENISFFYEKDRPVLNGLHFKMEAGQKIGLIGHNGSGKSTLLQVIMGLLKPASGTIKIFNTPVVSEKDFQQARKKIGLVFQNADDQLFSPTVLEDVAFGLLNHGHSPEAARSKSMSLLENLDLKGFENRITYKLSGGEKRLVALATVLVMEPRVLLLDEPFTGLDESTREHIFEVLNRLDISYIIVSHEFDALVRTTKTICSMENGKIVENGESDVLHSHFHQHPGGSSQHHHH